ncbi:type I-C CRISPR-associated protein Cas8c/Csd1 [Nocardioides sp. L-11A]|uniref:type I-C CRISPR-associated protein Cas8c/Csd1 n=1 Tax=Nocardioides sp. L-11A TaxID=3043848 RepID=UPI00249C50ED|nr:type I-C CRISPR-associated protein Cas8c/Csd1 [Nocardioides sp. L-11A]
MLLRALNEYGGAGGRTPAGYAMKTLGFVLQIDSDGEGCQLHSRYERLETPDGKSRAVAGSALIPNVVRTVKPVPMLGCDNASYVLGRPKAEKDPAKQEKEAAKAGVKCAAFDALLREYAETAGDDDALVFLRWRGNGEPGLERAIAALDSFSIGRLDLDPIAIQVGASSQIHSKPSAQSFWSARATSSKSRGEPRICLVCGRLKPVVDTLPQSLTGALIPATSTSNVALVSVNFPAASRGASGTGLRSAPICADCATGAVSAFNTLAASPDHRWGGRNEAQATIWWTEDGSVDFNTLEAPEPREVAAFLTALDRGHRPIGEFEDADHFYALTFSGNVARLVIRQWIDLPLLEAHRNVVAWFDDSAGPVPGRANFGVSEMARSCGDFVPSDGLFSGLPEGSRELLITCALTGAKIPRNLFTRAIGRARAETHYLSLSDARAVGVVRRRMHARFALIRLILNRSHLKGKPLPPHLDEDRSEPSYLSGRLFAVRESLQYQALGEVNASITDRYFERASANPASVDHALSTLEQQHLRALRRKGRRDAEIAFSKRVDDLHARCGAAPGRLTSEEQALWIAGYYQQRQANFQRAQENKQQTTSEEN